ncbi:MAG: rubredoxin [Pseudomonadales bacterium]|nr:rubredoxin [Pseudomonadales bacterium]MCP5184975.1 rubredoxin [Pseudomonadales bacterium]
MDASYRRWMCVSCFFEYDEEKGMPAHGIAPGTRFEDLPEDWECPECGSPKAYFEVVVH